MSWSSLRESPPSDTLPDKPHGTKAATTIFALDARATVLQVRLDIRASP